MQSLKLFLSIACPISCNNCAYQEPTCFVQNFTVLFCLAPSFYLKDYLNTLRNIYPEHYITLLEINPKTVVQGFPCFICYLLQQRTSHIPIIQVPELPAAPFPSIPNLQFSSSFQISVFLQTFFSDVSRNQIMPATYCFETFLPKAMMLYNIESAIQVICYKNVSKYFATVYHFSSF